MSLQSPTFSKRLSRALIPTVAGALLAVGVIAPAASAAPAADLASYVNPFVGTESEGNAYPGATVPFGMVQLSPNNTNNYGSTSYSPNAGRVWGFSHRNINSAGCPSAGELLVTPTTTQTPATKRAFLKIKDQAATEKASAGSYEVTLENDVKAELTATERTGEHRYTFPASTTSNLSFNVGQSLNVTDASQVRWVNDHTLEGSMTTGGFCWDDKTQRSTYFFSATFDRPATQTGVWDKDNTVEWGTSERSTPTGTNGAVAQFDTTKDRDVEVSVGVSFVDLEGARNNRVSEVGEPAKAFDDVRSTAATAWNKQLGAATITASDEAKKVFYTQLYKSFLSPTIGSDVDGRYVGMDKKVHTAKDFTYHQTFSLWDTYRTQAALHALLDPKAAEDIVRSMYQHRVEGGWLPRWSLGSNETNVMAGDPVSAWVAENFAWGTVPDDISDELWGYLVENATTTPPPNVASVGRRSAAEWIKNGHIPFYAETEPGLGQQFEEYRHGGSASMEFALSDSAIGAAAQRTGREGGEEFLKRGTNWQRLWNPDVELSGGFKGMVNAVRPDGTFVPTAEKAGVQQSGFHEGTPWQYQWMANQDFTGLQKIMGGEEEFLKRLDYYFDMPSLQSTPGVSPKHWAKGGSDYYSSIGFNPGNEPTIMNPWLYSSAGQPAKVNDVLSANLNRFPNTPGGGVGNDDLGTLSSWYVMATLGFQPIAPGSGILALNAPRVEGATLQLGEGRELTINAKGANESLPSYIRSVEVDGTVNANTWIDADDFRSAKTVTFDLADNADGLTWGTADSERLPSISDPLKVDATLSAEKLSVEEGTPATVKLGQISFTQAEQAAAKQASAQAKKAVTVAARAGEPVPAAQVPVTVQVEVDGKTMAGTATATDNGWDLQGELPALAAGESSAKVTVAASREGSKFAPAAFAAVSSETQLSVAKKAEPTTPGTDDSDANAGAASDADSDAGSDAGAEAGSDGGSDAGAQGDSNAGAGSGSESNSNSDADGSGEPTPTPGASGTDANGDAAAGSDPAPSNPVDAGKTPESGLAQTGAPVLPAVGLGLLLLIGAAILVARNRGARHSG